MAILLLILSSPLPVRAQTTLYWDMKTGTGAGPTPTGIWDTTTLNWDNTTAGTGTRLTYTSGSAAVFSAGTDAINAYTVTVSGTQSTAGILVEDGTPTITGGTLNFSDSTPTLDVSTGRTLNWGTTSIVSATNGLGINTDGISTGIINFTQNLNFSGTVTLGGGTLQLTSSTLTLGTLIITGNTTIDFAGTASSLSLANLTIASGVTVTINSWDTGTDKFTTHNFTGVTQDVTNSGSLSQISFTGSTGAGNRWQSYDKQITPVPEPPAAGAALLVMVGALTTFRLRRRMRA